MHSEVDTNTCFIVVTSLLLGFVHIPAISFLMWKILSEIYLNLSA